jgi:hypothetical protein
MENKKISVINLPRKVCNHLMGEEHTDFHRCTVGTCFIIIGVAISKVGIFFSMQVIQGGLDGIGYLIHAAGTVPFIELVTKNAKEPDKPLK